MTKSTSSKSRSKSATKKNVSAAQAGGSAESADERFLVVGLGASAGGIQALKVFFQNVPADSGMAYVVILHLSPDHDSQLAEVLQTVARIPVAQVTEKTYLKPDHVYVVPPDQSLKMVDGHLTLTPIETVEERRAPVDIFFRTLAETHKERAICVVLSGTGANGSMGLKRIKEKGGATFVQNPREAEYSDMPRNAIATDLVDAILNVAGIPAKIIAYRKNLGKIEIPVEPEYRADDQQQSLREIFTQLRVRTGHDFTNYKRPTILRRIERRINVRELADLPAYVAYLRENPDEVHSLLKDLLISVTNFFRDRKAFNYLEMEVLPRILQDKTAEHQVRAWVAGCATGEEAYSLAMLLAERTLGVLDAPAIQIFASDIDESAIATAREGFYTLNDAADVSPERLRRFFVKEGEGYRIRRELRETILFAHHNIVKDPPFSHLDLVTCRNLLIYLNRTAQERIMETLHFALEPGGYLFLGSSESVDGASDLYALVSKEHYLYQSRPAAARFSFPRLEAPSPSFHLNQPVRPVIPTQRQETHALERITYGDLHQQLLEQYAPPSIVVNEEYDIVHLSERAGRYLQVAGGELSSNLLKMLRPELRLELRTALYQAVGRQTNVEVKNLKVRVGDHDETISIHVRPVLASRDTARGFILVLFEEIADAGEQLETAYVSHEPIAHQLEEELMRVKEQLRTSAELHEVQAEELKASNEELQAMNEELRSAAEELETGKEELQSLNEELRTVNQELKIKIEEVTQTSNDFRNLINSTDIGTIFLDRSFRINLFSPAACEIFNLIPADIGRPLSNITSHLADDDLSRDTQAVLEKLRTIERELRTNNGRTFLLRATPYRTAEDRIGGVVITFLDITDRKRVEALLDTQKQTLEMVVAGSSLADVLTFLARSIEDQSDGSSIASILLLNEHRRLFNGAAPSLPDDFIRAIDGLAADENVGTCSAAAATGKMIITPDIAADPKWQNLKHLPLQLGLQAAWSMPIIASDGSVLGTFGTYFREKRRPSAFEMNMMGLFVRITALVIERERTDRALRESETRFRAMFEQSTVGTVQIAFDGKLQMVNPGFCKIIAYPEEECLSLTVKDVTHPDDYELEETENHRLLSGEVSDYSIEKRYVQKGGSIVWGQMTATLVHDGFGEPLYTLAIIEDITERKRAEEELKKTNERLEERVAGRTKELMEMNVNLQAEVSERLSVEAERGDLLRRLVAAQEDERRRIAREMHDQFGQQLTALMLRLNTLKEHCGEQKKLCEQVEAAEAITRQLDLDVDFLVWELRPTALDDLGLEAAMMNYTQNWSEHFGIPVELQTSGTKDNRFTSEIETVLYRIVQESLNNIAKHAQASRVDLVLDSRTDHVSLIVEDDGKGFDASTLSRAGDKGLGIAGIRERLALVGGTLLIETRPGSGTTIIVRIPISPGNEG